MVRSDAMHVASSYAHYPAPEQLLPSTLRSPQSPTHRYRIRGLLAGSNDEDDGGLPKGASATGVHQHLAIRIILVGNHDDAELCVDLASSLGEGEPRVVGGELQAVELLVGPLQRVVE